jgi:AraC-like DNA-binding protein
MTPLALLDFTAGAAMLGLTVLTAAVGFSSMRLRASRYLAAFYACVTVESVASLAIRGWREWLSIDAVRWLHTVNVPSAYLIGPLLYAYAAALTSTSAPVDLRRRLWHALPFCVVLVFTIGNALVAFDTSPVGMLMFKIVYHAWVLQGVPYLGMAAWHTYTARSLLEQVSADEATLQLAWLRRLVALIGVDWALAALQRFGCGVGSPEWLWLDTVLDWLIAIALYFLAWFGLRQRLLIPSGLSVVPASSGDATASRYARSGLDATQCTEVAADLTRLMTSERLYVDNQFDLQALSERSGWPPNYISQALNQGLQRNFFEFVNGFRVAAAEACLADPDDRRTVLEMALACGFGSKSTFNTVFKRMTGLTPSEFRRVRAPATDEAVA